MEGRFLAIGLVPRHRKGGGTWHRTLTGVFGVDDQESLLEIGIVILGAGILTGIVAVLYGRARGNGRHRAHKAQNPPAASNVSGERHRNIQTVAAR